MHPMVILAAIIGTIVLVAVFIMGAKTLYEYGVKVKGYIDAKEAQKPEINKDEE